MNIIHVGLALITCPPEFVGHHHELSYRRDMLSKDLGVPQRERESRCIMQLLPICIDPPNAWLPCRLYE